MQEEVILDKEFEALDTEDRNAKLRLESYYVIEASLRSLAKKAESIKVRLIDTVFHSLKESSSDQIMFIHNEVPDECPLLKEILMSMVWEKLHKKVTFRPQAISKV